MQGIKGNEKQEKDNNVTIEMNTRRVRYLEIRKTNKLAF